MCMFTLMEGSYGYLEYVCRMNKSYKCVSRLKVGLAQMLEKTFNENSVLTHGYSLVDNLFKGNWCHSKVKGCICR